MKLILLLFAIALTTAPETCNKYLDGKDLEEGICLEKKQGSDEILVRACTGSKFCEVTGVEPKGNCVIPSDVTGRYPGIFCDKGEQCLSRTCSNGKCEGVKAGKECKELKHCDPGLKCDKKPTSEGEEPTNEKVCLEPSTSGQGCESYLDCVVPLRCVGKKCVTIGSLDIGKESDDELACKSYHLADKADTTGVKVCAEAPKLKGQTEPLKEPKKCEKEDDCEYNDATIKNGCLCGKTANKDKYCKAYKGDFDLKKVSSSL